MKFIDTYENINSFVKDKEDTYLLHLTDNAGSIDVRYSVTFNIQSLRRLVHDKELKIPYLVDDTRQSDTPVVHVGLFDNTINPINKCEVQHIMFRLRLLCEKKHISRLVMFKPNFSSVDFGYTDFRSMMSKSFSDTNLVIICCSRKDIS